MQLTAYRTTHLPPHHFTARQQLSHSFPPLYPAPAPPPPPASPPSPRSSSRLAPLLLLRPRFFGRLWCTVVYSYAVLFNFCLCLLCFYPMLSYVQYLGAHSFQLGLLPRRPNNFLFHVLQLCCMVVSAALFIQVQRSRCTEGMRLCPCI